jgi:dihydrofolate synthase/folylpolyglutamate synthase
VVIVDAAHNPAGMAATVAALDESFDFISLIAVVAIAADKDVPAVLDQLEPVASMLVATTNSSGRAMPAEELADLAQPVFGPDRVRVAGRLDDAIELGVALADEADAMEGAGAVGGGNPAGGPGGAALLITGSVITAGEARLLLGGSAPGAGGAS